jgi:hypothetical protein
MNAGFAGHTLKTSWNTLSACLSIVFCFVKQQPFDYLVIQLSSSCMLINESNQRLSVYEGY